MKDKDKEAKKEPKPAEKPKGLAIALIVVGVVCAFALGFIAGGRTGQVKTTTTAPPAPGPVQVALQDGTTLGARLNKLEKSLQAMVEETKQAVGQGRLMDLTAIPTQFLDLRNVSRFASKGPANAPVTLVEFSDFQCPYCARMAMKLDELQKKYSEQIRIIFVDRPLTSKYKDGFPFHPYALLAHEAAAEALAQGKFWEMYSYIFEHQGEIFPQGRPTSQEDYDKNLAKVQETLVEIAGKLGLDSEKMKQSLSGHTHQAAILKSQALAEKMEIYSTPTVFVSSFFDFPGPDVLEKLLGKTAKIE